MANVCSFIRQKVTVILEYFRSLLLYFSNTVDSVCTVVALVVCAVIMRRALNFHSYQSVYHADTAVSESNGRRDI